MSTKRHRKFLLALAVGVASGCSSEATYPSNQDTGWWPEPDSGTVDSDPTPDDSDEPEIPLYWGLSGALTLIEGEASTATAELQLGLWNASAEALCVASISPVELEAAASPPGVDVYAWWDVTLDLTSSDPCAWPEGLGSAFAIGLGALDALLFPAMDANGYAHESTSGYGLYLQSAPTAPVFVFGLAGTDEDFAGSSTPVTAPPLPDGRYRLEGLHLLPLD